jgi:hypothetical protein
MKQLATVFSVIVMLVQISFSQSEFLRRGQNGFGGGLGFSVNSEMTGMSFYAGYSYKGFLNLDLTYSKADGGKVTDGVITPTITYYFIKQEDGKRTPTLGVSLGYSRYTSKTTQTVAVPDSNMQGRDITLITEKEVNALRFGVSAQHRIGYWKMFFFQPLLAGELIRQRHSLEFTLRGGVAVGTRIQNGPLLIFTPAIERRSGLTTFVFTFGTVF